ncbi:nucleoside triphosphate pyrophosphohydrolase [Neptunomonas antarctica]|uniref:Nucleoside triphosphate pyrophosphohydrolase n=1 Tax=Neptunomonas antarctica TaxID=619304 RepID=A0A1N7MZL7_9GAMM|nr:nucleoside triphosphate pyrophosphohydrolase [Neptunomonas antarctica]SIS91573.1 ATP diphosphatase [Neptunomonas antarctica]
MSIPYVLSDLIYLMGRLRDPEYGCPWDLQQDFSTIVPHTLEEAYEVADTIERKDWAHLEDELGDLLFQVIFYSQLGKEQSLFEFNSIVNQLVTKLIRRHPHVFPDGKLSTPPGEAVLSEAEVSANWEIIKQQERAGKKKTGILDDVPRGLPALSRADKLQKRASQVGFDWNDPLLVLDKMEEEIAELREAIEQGNQAAILDEMGDVIFTQVNLARHLGVKAEIALRSTNQKFERRFNYVEACVESSGQTWDTYSLDELDQFWSEAKQQGL